MQHLGSNRGFIKWPVDAACGNNNGGWRSCIEGPVSSLNERQVSSEQLASNIHPRPSCLQTRAGEHPGLFSSARIRSPELPHRLKVISPLIQEASSSEEDRRKHKDIHISTEKEVL